MIPQRGARREHGEAARLSRRVATATGQLRKLRDVAHEPPKEAVHEEHSNARMLGLAVAAAIGVAGAAQAQISDNVIKIGVLSDMSSLYTDLAGAGSVVAAKMAVEDSGIEKRGYKVEIVSADHQNKPDVGSAIARQWYDTDKVDVIVDVPNSGVALAVNQITKDKGKAFLVSGAGVVGPHRQGLLAQHGPLDLRHVDAGQRHRQRDRQDGRRHVVLHHRRLRVRRRRSSATPTAVVIKNGGKVLGERQGAAQQPGLQLVPAAGAGVEGEDHRPRQRRRRHDQLDQAGGRVRHRQGRPEPRRAAGVPDRHPRARACRRRRA